jgi:hypothetical protein
LTVLALVLVAAALALLFGGPVFLGSASRDPLVLYAGLWVTAGIAAVVCGLSAAGAARSRRRWGVVVSKVVASVAGLCVVGVAVGVRDVGPMPGLALCEARLDWIRDISLIRFVDTGRVPQNISELVSKQVTGMPPEGMLSPESVICPYDRRHPYPYTEAGGSSYVLAPLDKVFFDEKFFQENPGVILCVYCTVVHSRWRPARTYVTTDGHAGITSGDDLQAWESVQAEAVTWLEDAFPMDELERFAQSTERHRRELASAILRYRLDKKERQAPRGNGRAP